MNAPAQSVATTPSSPKDVLFGRLMMPDHSEHPFQVSQISAEGATILTSVVAPKGIRIVAYIDEIGRVEAEVIAEFDGGIALKFLLSENRRNRLAEKLQWLAENDRETANQRRHERFEPKDTKSHLVMPDGRIYQCEVIDISVGGAGIRTQIMPKLGTYVMLGKMRGRVVRYIQDGIAIEFVRPLANEALKAQVG